MSLTIDCGEGKHAVCRGRGKQHFLVPQLDDGEEFECDCWCHDEQQEALERMAGLQKDEPK